MNKIVFSLLLCMVLLTLPALASAEEGGSVAFHFNWVAFLGKLFNSVILFGGLFLILRKPLVQLLSQQGSAIQVDIEERENRIRQNQKELESLRLRLARLEEELETLKRAASDSGRQEVERLRRQGEEETKKILSRTEDEIDARIQSAIKKLKERIAEMTISHFSKDVEKHLDAPLHQKLIERGIEGVKSLDERK